MWFLSMEKPYEREKTTDIISFAFFFAIYIFVFFVFFSSFYAIYFAIFFSFIQFRKLSKQRSKNTAKKTYSSKEKEFTEHETNPSTYTARTVHTRNSYLNLTLDQKGEKKIKCGKCINKKASTIIMISTKELKKHSFITIAKAIHRSTCP